MARNLLFLILFLALNAAAYFLGSFFYSQSTAGDFLEDPERVLMTLLDESLGSAQKEWLAQHLPKLYKFEYACRLESRDGKETQPLWAGGVVHTFTAEMPILRCPRGILASFQPGSQLSLKRRTDDKLTFELQKGSAFFEAFNSNGIVLTSGTAGLRIASVFPHFRLYAEASEPILEVFGLNGEFQLKPVHSGRGEKQLMVRMIAARGHLEGDQVIHAGVDYQIRDGIVRSGERTDPESLARIAELKRRFPEIGSLLPEFKQLSPTGTKMQFQSNVTLVSLEKNAQCGLEFYTNERGKASLEFPISPSAPTVVALPRFSNFLMVTWCADSKTKAFTAPFALYVQ